MRLIDADALKVLLIDVMENIKKNPMMTRDEAHIISGCHMLCEMCDDAPTIYAVQVVRCKDCKHRGTSYDCPFRRIVFTEAEGYHYDDCTMDDSFCSFGEKKEEV